MAKYFGVKCKTCGTPIALAVRKPILEGKTININVVPLASIVCPECGDSHEHSSRLRKNRVEREVSALVASSGSR